jgi:RNA polymerase sigma-70 factor, ECF subfamily
MSPKSGLTACSDVTMGLEAAHQAEELVSGVEPAGFDEFYRREYASVVRLAFALVGTLAVAEELAQEAFLAAFRDWERVGRYDQPGAWVRRVVTNRGVSVWRRVRIEARWVSRSRRELSVEVQLPEDDAAVWEALRRLPRRQRQVLALIALDDQSVNDVARLLQCSPESVRTHLRRGRAAITKYLESMGVVEP